MPATRVMHTSPPKQNEAPPGYTKDPHVGPMLAYERSLPSLPVPPLSHTIPLYLSTIAPHLTPSQLEHSTQIAHTFAKSQQGMELQTRLEARGKEEMNWLAEWWDAYAYMGVRDPVVPFVSYYYVHRDNPRVKTPAKRAAELVVGAMKFREMVETQQLEPDKMRNTPLAMSSFKWLFNASRYPAKYSDTARKFNPDENNHVVFVRKNKFFEVGDVRGLGVAELEGLVQKVIAMAGNEQAPPVGALTSENRDTWADAREELLSASALNKSSLERIESAVIVVSLDDSQPVTREEIGWACWAGNGRNRWYDKHQFIIFDNGRSGFLGEHSCMDGTPTLRMNEFVLYSASEGKIPAQAGSAQGVQVKELPFELDERCMEYVKKAEANFDEVMAKHEMHVLHYEAYGSRLIKTFKASPDGWAQMIMQLAWHRMFGRPGVCYESAQTRRYQRGRTEVIRSASSESRAWAEAMCDPDAADTHRATLFRAALKRHVKYATLAAEGMGVDRHLFGLKQMLREGEPVPEIYTDEAYGKTNHWEMSTSQLSSRWVVGWGYGEVVSDGFGLAYAIGDDHLRWTVTSVRGDGARLKYWLGEAATEVREMMERAAKAEEGHEKSKL